MSTVEFNDLVAKLKDGITAPIEAILSEQKEIIVNGKKYSPDEFSTAIKMQMQPVEAPSGSDVEKMKKAAGIKKNNLAENGESNNERK